MPVSVTLPALGESVTEGTVTRWLKQEGDTVQADEPLLEISTDKVDTEIPAPASGTLLQIKVREDETVEVGAELAVIAPAGAAAAGAPAEQPPAEQAPAAEAAAAPSTPAAAPSAAPPEQAPAAESRAAAPPEAPPSPAPPPPAAPAPAPAPSAAPAPAPAAGAGPEAPPAPAPPDGRPAEAPADVSAYVTPLVRRLAAENDIDLSQIRGTGVGGRIRKQDVLDAAKARAAEQPPAAPAAAPAAAPPTGQPQPTGAPAKPLPQMRIHTEPMSRLRKIIATRMVESLHVSGQLTTVIEVDVSRIGRLRDRVKADFEAREGVRLSFLPFFAKATVEGLRQHPKLNASVDIDKGEIIYHDTENLGIAVDTERGLVVPVIHDAGDLSLAGLARRIADIAARTRQNKITPDELFGGTFTLTNTGSRGALFDTPIINQPQVGILCTGAVIKRPVVIDDPELGETIAIRSMAYLALTYDHRLVDGADAARFLVTVKQRLEEGRFESDLGL
jgi:pyruvate dehydrogenase E2 component (dihydrolipoamide acetyltransferase)